MSDERTESTDVGRKSREAFLQLQRAINSADIEILGGLSYSELTQLGEASRRLQDRIQEQLEWFGAPDGYQLKRFLFQENGSAFYAEAVENGVLINPALSDNFYNTDNKQRSPEELARWWLRPFIEIETWEQREEGMRDNFFMLELGGEKRTPEEIEAAIAISRAAWFKSWPSGKRYEVHCLDGGAWDRPTGWGMFPTLEEALACIDERCKAD